MRTTLESTWQDVRYGVRMLQRHPAFATAAILTIALSIGASTAVFTVVDETLFRSLPYAYGDRLVDVFGYNKRTQGGGSSFTPAIIRTWRAQPIFERFEAQGAATFDISDGDAERVTGLIVSPGIFSMLGVAPDRGRVFDDADARTGAAPTVLIGDALWKRRFGGAADVVGRRMTLNHRVYTVIGVMPKRFQLRDEQLWVPLDLASADPTLNNFMGLARLPAAVDVATAQQRADKIAETLPAPAPPPYGWDIRIGKKQVAFVSDNVRRGMFVLLGAVGFLLLIGCANVANLMLVRSAEREREMGVRAALGASRVQLVRQMLIESLLISTAGGALGLLIAAWGTDALVSLLPASTLSFVAGLVQIDGRIVAFAAVLTFATGIVFGLLPALRGSRVNLDAIMRARGGRTVPGRVPSLLVLTEVALALVLLVGAALMTRTFVRLNAIDPGFEPRGLMSFAVSVPTIGYPTAATRAAFSTTVEREVAAVPGVQGVAIAEGLPGNAGFSTGVPEVQGAEAVSAAQLTMADNTVDPPYFSTLHIPVLAGRLFDAGDAPNAVVINKAFADYLWPDGNAVGRTFRAYAPAGNRAAGPGAWSTVVGVVGNIEARLGDDQLKMQIYYPFVAHPPAGQPAAVRPPGAAARRYYNRVLVVRGTDPSALLPAIKARVHAVAPSAVVTQVSMASEVYADFFAPQRFALVLMTIFSTIAMFYASAGIFNVLSQAVAARTREIGVRVALGAQANDIFRLIVMRGLLLTGEGLVVGSVGALALSHVLRGLLYEVSPYDPISFAGVVLLLMAASALACWLPTRRALRIEAADALRVE